MLLGIALVVSGCSNQPLDRDPKDASDTTLPEVSTEVQLDQTPVPKQGPGIAIVISSGNKQSNPVVRALVEQGQGRTTRFSFDNASPPVIWDLVKQQGFEQVIVVGTKALQSAPTVTSANIVYCQTLKEQSAQSRGLRGVAALPDFRAQLEYWLDAVPDLKTIGTVTSTDMLDLVEELRTAADELGLSVTHTTVDNDRQLLSAFQRMVPNADGYVFFPDTRVLSPDVIRHILAYSNKHNLSVLAYNQIIVDLGAQLGIAADPDEIAALALRMLATENTIMRELPQRVKVLPGSASAIGDNSGTS
jgi:hypothetical protein